MGKGMTPGRVLKLAGQRQRGLEQRQPRVLAGRQVQEPTDHLRGNGDTLRSLRIVSKAQEAAFESTAVPLRFLVYSQQTCRNTKLSSLTPLTPL